MLTIYQFQLKNIANQLIHNAQFTIKDNFLPLKLQKIKKLRRNFLVEN